MKTCTKCKIEKEVTEFHRDKTRKDGLDYRCKPCIKIKTDAYGIANREVLRARTQLWRDGNKEYQAAYAKKYNQTEAGRVVSRKADQAKRARKRNSAALYNKKEAEIFAELTRQALALT